MLIAMGIGVLFGWLPTRLIVSRWPKWWVAVLSLCAVMILLFAFALIVAGIERAGGATVDRMGRLAVSVVLSGSLTAVFTARNCLRRAKADSSTFNDRFGYQNGGLG